MRVWDWYDRSTSKQRYHFCQKVDDLSIWGFPRNENAVLKFLDLYAGVATKHVRLSYVSIKILHCLPKKCPKIEGISFGVACDEPWSETCKCYLEYGDIRDPSNLIPTLENMPYSLTNLRNLEINVDCVDFELFDFFSQRFNSTEQVGGIISLLGQSSGLRRIRLSGFQVTTSKLNKMIQNKNLREINFFHPHIGDYKFVPKGKTVVSVELDDMLSATLGSLTYLETFKLDCSSQRKCRNDKAEESILRFGATTNIKLHIDNWQCMAEQKLINQLDNLPTCISHLKHLKALSLRGNIVCHDSAYDLMFSELPNLEMLELHELTATTAAVSYAGKYLKNLKFLRLGKGEFSDESLLNLYHHPSLMKFQIYVDDNSGGFPTYSEPEKRNWLKRVNVIYDFLLTLPQIRDVTLESSNLYRVHTGRDLPVIEAAKIEIVSTSLY